MCMKITEVVFVQEGISDWISKVKNFIRGDKSTPVQSTWITNLSFSVNQVTMSLSNGSNYIVDNVDKKMYKQWISAPSKGKFFHDNIRKTHNITRA